MRYGPISSFLYGKLQQITPSRADGLSYYPCLVRMKDRTVHERVYVMAASDYIKIWGIYPEDDPGKRAVPIDDVADLGESPLRIPPLLANELYDAGESGMGYRTFRVKFRNGSTRSYLTGGAVDFIPLPTGLTTKDVVAVEPHRGRGDTAMSGSPYAFCLFEGISST